ncbi:MAG: phage head closure protein [Bacilli bacterium]|nr:phage head closure protein [Bacilli bacterium]
MQNFKLNITEIPTYLDGKFKLFEIKQKSGHFPIEYIEDTKKEIWFQELSITDRLRFEAEQREKDLTFKIRIPQTKEITSLHVLKIGDEYHKVFNAYHFTNKEGYKQSDITLVDYPNPKLEEDINE